MPRLSLAQKIRRIDDALTLAHVPHAFGGAFALAYCTADPRATNDIDLNLFVGVGQARAALGSLPRGVGYDDEDIRRIERDGQARLWWGDSPVDVFFSNHDFHERARRRARIVPFAGSHVPVLDCTDLVVFKTLYGRTKDFADIEAMAAAGTVDVRDAIATVAELLGADHPNLQRLRDALRA